MIKLSTRVERKQLKLFFSFSSVDLYFDLKINFFLSNNCSIEISQRAVCKVEKVRLASC